jgi:hypothetical protein
VDDACDNCPTVINPDQQNGDQDGLGDACEDAEDPGLLGGIQYFEPFLSASNWTQNAVFEQGTDEMTTIAPCAGLCLETLLWTASLTGTWAVEATFRMTTNGGYTGVVFSSDGDSSFGSLELHTAAADRSLAFWPHPGGGQALATVQQAETAQEPAQTWRRLRVTRSGDSITGEFWNGSGAYKTLSLGAAQSGLATEGMAGLVINAASARFQSFVIYH